MVEYDDAHLPPVRISSGGHTWEREQFDTAGWNWVRPMDETEYEWDASSLSLHDTDEPVYAVELHYLNGTWNVAVLQTQGPDYHRPGFTEEIGGQWHDSYGDFEDACSCVESYIESFSQNSG